MKNLSCSILAAAIGIGCLGGLDDGSASAETLRIQGSSSFLSEVISPHQARIEALAAHRLSVAANSSDRGLLAVLKGEADLAMVTDSAESLVAILRESAPDLPYDRLLEFRVAEARVAFPVHPDNPVRRVRLGQLRQILTGQIDNWRQLGGPDRPIRVVSLHGGSAKRTVERSLLEGQHMTPRSEVLVETVDEIVETVAHDRGALGIAWPQIVKLHRLPELWTKSPVVRWYSFITLGNPMDAMRAVIAATRRVAFGDEP